jgi:glycosyltransferase involved in cell wall biosynthesis
VRVVFLVPALRPRWLNQSLEWSHAHLFRRLPRSWVPPRIVTTDQVSGGTLNIFRHCEVAQLAGAEGVIATTDGKDSYRDVLGSDRRLRFIRWKDRSPDDLCVVPDFASRLTDQVEGPAVVYEQSPLQVRRDFLASRPTVRIWTDSPYMQQLCEAAFPEKPIQIVPNVVDDRMFPFVPQRERQPGLLFAFPRKNPDFIAETLREYHELGGRYWKLELIHGLSIQELARRFREPQAFLASAQDEGCALPPQEAMAAGIVVIGRTAKGANFSMEDGHTALTAETPFAAAQRLLDAESPELRDRVSLAGRELISRFFPGAEPLAFWRETLRTLG